MPLKVYGSSDDLIEIEGDIYDEYCVNFDSDNDEVILALSNGIALAIKYNDCGLWKISQIAGNPSDVKFTHIATDPDSDAYSDVAEISKDVEWIGLVPFADFYRRKKPNREGAN
jgi:hypothetical protein